MDGYSTIKPPASVPFPFNVAAAAGIAVQTASILLRSVRSNLAVAGLYQQRAALQMFIAQRSQLCQTHRPVPRDLPLSLVNGKDHHHQSDNQQNHQRKRDANQPNGTPAILLEEAEDRVAASVLNPNSRIVEIWPSQQRPGGLDNANHT